MAQQASSGTELVIRHAVIITMDGERRVLLDGAMALRGEQIAWVGRDSELPEEYAGCETLDGSKRILAPGFINGHVHVTGDPLTRHYMADNLADPNRLHSWVIPRYEAHDEADEHISAQFCALEMLRGGTTTFVEAGTIRHLDAAAEGLASTGIRGRIGGWVEGRSFDDMADETALTDTAIRTLEDQAAKYPQSNDGLIAAWPILIGHNTNTDRVWQAAAAIAQRDGTRLCAHMSPYRDDPDWYLAHTGKRPIAHLETLGVLGESAILTHMTHLDEAETRIVAETGTSIGLCPFAALKGAFGAGRGARYVELLRAGTGFLLGTDGYECDILRAARLATSLFKDMAEDIGFGSALRGLEMVTCEAARAAGLDHLIGSLEAGKRADFLMFDRDHFDWRPLLSPLDQLHWSASPSSLRDVWVNGRQVIADGHSAIIDEEQLLGQVQDRAEAIIERTNLPFIREWKSVR